MALKNCSFSILAFTTMFPLLWLTCRMENRPYPWANWLTYPSYLRRGLAFGGRGESVQPTKNTLNKLVWGPDCGCRGSFAEISGLLLIFCDVRPPNPTPIGAFAGLDRPRRQGNRVLMLDLADRGKCGKRGGSEGLWRKGGGDRCWIILKIWRALGLSAASDTRCWTSSP